MKELESLRIRNRQKTAEFLLVFDQAVALAEAQGERFDNSQKKALLEEALENGEEVLGHLANSIQMAENMDWEHIKDRVRNFDGTTKGLKRLKTIRIKTTDSVSQVAHLERAKCFSPCEHCKGKHPSANCWKKYPEKRPKGNKRRFEEKHKPTNSVKKFRFDVQKESVSMICDSSDSVSLVQNSDQVFLDTCAMNYVWIFKEQPEHLSMRLVTGKLGTASKDGQLTIMGVIKIGKHFAYWCPEARRNLLSLGVLRKLKCDLLVKHNDEPMILTRDQQLLKGSREAEMPAFELQTIIKMAVQDGRLNPLCDVFGYSSESESEEVDMVKQRNHIFSIEDEGIDYIYAVQNTHFNNTGIGLSGLQRWAGNHDEPYLTPDQYRRSLLDHAKEPIGYKFGMHRELYPMEPTEDDNIPTRHNWCMKNFNRGAPLKGYKWNNQNAWYPTGRDADEYSIPRIVEEISALSDTEQLKLVHYRLGHIGVNELANIFSRKKATGFYLPRSVLGSKSLKGMHKCNDCMRTKMTRHNFPKNTARSYEREGTPGHF